MSVSATANNPVNPVDAKAELSWKERASQWFEKNKPAIITMCKVIAIAAIVIGVCLITHGLMTAPLFSMVQTLSFEEAFTFTGAYFLNSKAILGLGTLALGILGFKQAEKASS